MNGDTSSSSITRRRFLPFTVVPFEDFFSFLVLDVPVLFLFLFLFFFRFLFLPVVVESDRPLLLPPRPRPRLLLLARTRPWAVRVLPRPRVEATVRALLAGATIQRLCMLDWKTFNSLCSTGTLCLMKAHDLLLGSPRLFLCFGTSHSYNIFGMTILVLKKKHKTRFW